MTKANFRTCHDGRCAVIQDPSSTLSSDVCMTPFSCSPGYFKVDTSVGEFCWNNAAHDEAVTDALSLINFLAHTLNQYHCPPDYLKCLDGTCERDLSFCRSEITCPIKTHPIRCQDGQCVQEASFCSGIDSQAQ